jgi:hypothetical protein
MTTCSMHGQSANNNDNYNTNYNNSLLLRMGVTFWSILFSQLHIQQYGGMVECHSSVLYIGVESPIARQLEPLARTRSCGWSFRVLQTRASGVRFQGRMSTSMQIGSLLVESES